MKKKRKSKKALEPFGWMTARPLQKANGQKKCSCPERVITLDGELCWTCGLAWPLEAYYPSPAAKSLTSDKSLDDDI